MFHVVVPAARGIDIADAVIIVRCRSGIGARALGAANWWSLGHGWSSCAVNARRSTAFLEVAELAPPQEQLPASALRDTMEDDKREAKRTGNEPAPLLMIAVAVVPLIAIVAWLLGVFG
jgi:hypothetical protein